MATASQSRRPTTPLRRLSSSSLRSLSLSHSRTHPGDTDALGHLAPVFAELADGMADLAANFEALDKINSMLDGFNESFGAYLYALRMNAYTADFTEAPTPADFTSFLSRQAAPASPPRDATRSPTRSPSPENETFMGGSEQELSVVAEARQQRKPQGKGVEGGKGGARAQAAAAPKLTKRQQAEQMAFADSVIKLLPIPFRENPPQRGPAEQIIILLRDHPAGIAMTDLTAYTGVATQRANECLTALVRAKIVLRITSKGVAMYRLDPVKYPR